MVGAGGGLVRWLGERGAAPLTCSAVLTPIVVVIHVIVSSIMLVLVLLHSGKGGGLSDMFGGGMGAAAQGSTVMEKNLDRLTLVAAIIFAFTTVVLGLRLSTYG